MIYRLDDQYREILGHRISDEDVTRIFVLGDPDSDGVCYEYAIATDARPLARVSFQNGLVQEYGINGVSPEHLLAVVLDHLKGIQSGPKASENNSKAIDLTTAALAAIQLSRR